MIIQNNLNIENPKKVKLPDLIMFYLSNIKKKDKRKESKSENNNTINNSLKLQKNIHDIILTNLIDTQMEIDIVTEIEADSISELKKAFPKNIFFQDEILKDIGEKDNKKITLVAEIAKNIILQGNQKLKKTVKYVEFNSILNLFKDNFTNFQTQKFRNLYLNIIK